ncbi:MAG: hypothetical protein KDA42_07585 [Planctomycetales bacterium]|nr:hypothetical protein [Planctomycetales bacterium]
MNTAIESGNLRAAKLEYAIDAGRLGVPVAVSRIGARQVSYEEVPSEPLSERSIGTLQVVYPHPAGREGMALVGVVIQQRRATQRGMLPRWKSLWRDVRGGDATFVRDIDSEMHEAWVLDIPKAELDALLRELADTQSTSEYAHSGVGVHLSGSIDGHNWKLRSQGHPALDTLMQRVRCSGQLVSFRGSAQPETNRWQRPASLVAWEQSQPGFEESGTMVADATESIPSENAVESHAQAASASDMARLPQTQHLHR